MSLAGRLGLFTLLVGLACLCPTPPLANATTVMSSFAHQNHSSQTSSNKNKACTLEERLIEVTPWTDGYSDLWVTVSIKNRTKVWQFAEFSIQVTDKARRSLLASNTQVGAIPPNKARALVQRVTLSSLYQGQQDTALKLICDPYGSTKVALVNGTPLRSEQETYELPIVLDNKTPYPVNSLNQIHVGIRNANGQLIGGCLRFPDLDIPAGLRVATRLTSGVCSNSSFLLPDNRIEITVAALR